MLERIKVLQQLKEFEKNNDITLFNSQYGNLWPLFRNHIAWGIFFKKRGNRLYRELSYLNRLRQHFKLQKPVADVKTSEIWMSNYRLRNENKYNYNKYIDPFFEKFAKENALLIESNSNKGKRYTYPHLSKNNLIYNIWSVSKYYKLTTLFYHIFSDEFNFKKFSLKYEILSKEFSNIPMFSFFAEFKQFVEEFYFYSFLFSKFPNLKKIYTISYYSAQGMALNAAAHKKNIQTIEIQHGLQSNEHHAYGSWQYIPPNGYELLPSKFYVYSKFEEKIIHDNFQYKHGVKIVGNLTFESWLKTSSEQKQKKYILISLQKRVIPASDFLYAALKYLKNKHPEKIILFRLHPRHTYIKKDMDIILKKLNIEFEWDKQTEVYDTLSETILHITSFSSVIMDACNLNIPSIIYTDLGVKFYEKFLSENELVNKALNINDFLNTANKYL